MRESITASHPSARFYATGTPDMRLALTTFEIPGVDSAKLQIELRKIHRREQASHPIRIEPEREWERV